METYRNIGEAYEYVEQIEDYGPGGLPYAQLGLWFDKNYERAKGINDLLLELHRDFEMADTSNYEKFKLIIVPSQACLSAEEGEMLNTYAQNGGRIIVLGEGALVEGDTTKTALSIGAKVVGKSPYNFDFTLLKSDTLMSEDMVSSPFLNYESGLRVEPTEGTVLAAVREPYFNRTYEHYSSHRETPYRLEDSSYPAVLKNGNIIFFAHALDHLYTEHGVRLHRELLKNAIDLLYPDPILQVENLPSAGRVNLLQQGDKNRYVVHLLYSPPIQRGAVRVIEDFLPVPDVGITLRVPEQVKKAYMIPGNQPLELTSDQGTVAVTVPEFTMHTGVVFEY